MLVTLGFCEKDWRRSIDLFNWCAELDGQYLRHRLLLVADRSMDLETIRQVVFAAKQCFPKAELIKPLKDDKRGWPSACNTMFAAACDYVKQQAKCPFFWIEYDSIPLRPGWLDEFEYEYQKCGKPFMGCISDDPYEHLTGVAIYPPNPAQFNPAVLNPGKQAWDLVDSQKTLAHAHHTDLYQHEWGDPNPWSFPNAKSLQRIKPEAALFHRNKDGTLIKRLRERRSNPIVSRLSAAMNLFPSKPEPARKNLFLPDVTLAAVDGTRTPRLTENSLFLTSGRVTFGETLLFATTRPWCKFELYTKRGCRFIKIPPTTLDGYNRFCLGELHKHIKTSHCLTVQADSCVVTPQAWNPSWLQYDYIGAPWPAEHTGFGIRVGNSGFCLRSKRLLEATASLPTQFFEWQGRKHPGCRDDILTCIMYRKKLEDMGLKFAPLEVALAFSFEQPTKECDHLNGQFGRHEWHQEKT